MQIKITINIDDRIPRFFKDKILTKRNMVILFSLSFLMGTIIYASVITKPHTFNDGDIVSASKFNENFDILYQKVNVLDNSISHLLFDPDPSIYKMIKLDINTKYTVPSGKTLFVYGSSRSMGPGFDLHVNDFYYYNFPGGTCATLKSPLIIKEGSVLSFNASAGQQFYLMCLEIDSKYEVKNIKFTTTTTYTVPVDKKLFMYTINSYMSEGIDYYVDSTRFTHSGYSKSFERPFVIPGGSVLKSEYGTLTITGFEI